jgi:hypothetical protein
LPKTIRCERRPSEKSILYYYIPLSAIDSPFSLYSVLNLLSLALNLIISE